MGEGLLWAEPPIDICNETTTYEHHPRGRSAPASEPRAPREANDPLAFAQASVRLPVSALRRACETVPGAARRGSTTGSGFASDREPQVSLEPAEVQPRTDCPEVKGSQPFGRLASSPPSKAAEHPCVTSLLPRKPGELPPRLAWPVAPSFPGGEEPRSASLTGRGLRSHTVPRRPALSRKPGCFPPIVAALTGGSPLCSCGSVSPSRRPGRALRIGRPAPFLLFPSASP